jgi:hypothetical protein
MIIFRITAERDGLYVGTHAARSGPCLSRALAIEPIEGRAGAIRAHGEAAVADAGDGGVSVLDDLPVLPRALAS